MKLLNSPQASLRSKIWRVSIQQTLLKLALIMLASIKMSTCQDFDIGLSTYSINQYANYQVFPLGSSITGYPIPAGAIFLITFPKQYNITTLRNKTYSGYDSLSDECPFDSLCGGVSVNFKANGFEITGLFTSPLSASDQWYLAYTIFNIFNPSTMSTLTFAFTIYKGTTIYYPLSTTASSITSVSFIMGAPNFTYQVINPYIWGISPLKFIITPNNLIDTIRITFPSIKWVSQTQNFPPLIPIVTCNSVSNPTITCTYLSFLTVSNLSYFTVGQTIDLTVNSIYNPSTVMAAGSITLALLSGGTIIQSSQFSIASSNFVNDILRNPSASLTYLANDFIQIFVTFQIPQSVTLSDRIYVTFPSEISIPLTTASYTIRMASQLQTPVVTPNSATNTISFNMAGLSLGQTIISVTATGIARPRQCKNLSSFVIKTYRSNVFLMDTSTCCTLSLANRITLTINIITPINPKFLKTSSYIFSVTTFRVNLITTDSIKIIFPSQYSNTINATRNATICSSISILGTNFPAKIISSPGVCNVGLNTIALSSFISSNLGGSQTLTITIAGIVNPSTSPTKGFTISTLSSTNYVLQTAQNYMVSLQPNTFVFAVVPSSYKTCQQNVVYNFTIANNSPLANGYSIELYFPIDYSFINYNQLTCSVNNINYSCGRANSTYRTSNIIVVVKITTAISAINFLTVSSVTNPISYATTGTFSVIIKDHTNTATQSSSGSVTVTMSSQGNFGLFTATASNYSLSTAQLQQSVQTLTSQGNSIWFTIVLPFTPVSSSTLTITIIGSNYVNISGISKCNIQQTSYFCLNSTIAGNIEILLTNIELLLPNSNFLQIQVTNLFIKDFFNLRITAALTVNSYSSLRLASLASLPKLYSQSISNYNIAFSNTTLGQVSTATMTIILSATALSLISSITIYIPLQFSVAQYTQTFPKSSLISNQITIPNLTNPITKQYTPFLFSAQDSSGNIIAVSSPTDNTKQYSFYWDCDQYCRTCSSPSVCIDCYTDITWIDEIYFRNSTETCVTKCQVGQYLNNGICYECDANCLTCLMYQTGFTNGISNFCLTCIPSMYLYGSTCVIGCPTGYYSSYNICQLCPPNCINCTSAIFCTSCQTPYSLYGGYCLETCPNKTISVSNGSESSCINCSNNCISCTSALSPLCLSCSSSYYLYNGACYLSCSLVSLFSNSLRTCVACQCKTCLNYAYYCTSCNSTYNLYMNQCISNCPTGYYPLNNTCNTCSANCLSCTSLAYCTICQIPMAVYKTSPTISTCVSTCPNTTITTIDSTSLFYTCSICGGDCLTCSISITFCLTCKAGFVLNNNTCVLTCPTNKYLISGACRDCALQCRVCLPTDPYNCSICSSNYFYFNNSCINTCPAGRYSDITTLNCLLCNPVCSTCLNSTNCTTCAAGFYLSNYFCYPNCISIDPLLYSYNGTCISCQPQCTTCLSTPFQCSSCKYSSYYFNPVDKSCSMTCISPYYINGTQCSLCKSPCNTCDTLYDSCLTCTGTLSVLNGLCYSTCPDGYYTQSKVCTQCPKQCLTCSSSSVCMACQSYAYRYYKSCVLNCKNTADLQITIDNFCTSCASVPYCQTCQPGTGNNFVCFICVYPYVIFQGNCLNQCPNLYMVDNSSNTCVQSPEYSLYLSKVYQDNYPYFPPFCFIGLYGILSVLCYLISKFTYKYSYHYGYLIALLSIFEQIFFIYGFIHIFNLYKGDYTQQNKQIPLYILAGSEGLRIILAILFISYVIFYYYSNDMGFKQWKNQHTWSFRISTIFTFIFGTRFFKLYYSKFMGKSFFSYRIISVQKFYPQDLFTWLSFLPDIIDFSAFAIIAYNIFITYSVLYIYPFELLLIKGCQWIMLLRDLKKPDRGFFLGQEQEAQRQMQLEKEQREKDRRKFEMQSLVKLIRRKSAANLHHQRLYEHLFFDDFRSVYNPDDYQQVPKMPNRRILKGINKGKFRKGKKITIQQKLNRFAESIKPSPIVTKDQSYLRNLLYWKPPKMINIKKKQQSKPSDESMLKLLQDKQMYYDRVSSIQVLDIEDDNQVDHDGYSRIKRRKYTNRYADEQTVVNEDPSSLQYIDVEEDNDVNQLFNRNYAKRQHLPSTNINDRYDDNDLRVLYHQPLKKRKSKLNQIRSRYY